MNRGLKNNDKIELKSIGYSRMLICLLFFLQFTILYAQDSKIDSISTLVNNASNPIEKGKLLLKLGKLYSRKDVDKYRGYVDQARDLKAFSEIKNNAHQIAFHYAYIDVKLNQFDEAKTKFHELLKSPHLDSSTISLVHYNLGNLLRKEGNNSMAIEHLLISKEIDRLLGDRLHEASTDIVLGIIHKQTKQFPKALEFYNNAYEVYEEYDQKENMSTVVLNMANVYMRQDSLEKALQQYNRALDLANQTEKDEDLLAYIYNNLSNLHVRKNDNKLALEYALKSYDLRKNLAGPKEKLNSLVGIAGSQKALGKTDQALETINDALDLATDLDGVVEELQHLYDIKYKIHKDRNELKKTINSLELYVKYHDSLSNTELNKQAIELNKKYETAQKENEIDLLKVQQENDAIKLSVARIRTLGLTFGLVLFSALLFWVYKLYQKTKSQNLLISSSLQEKDILLREIHHRVKNNLQFISSLLGLQSEHIEDSKALHALQEGQDRVQSMALIHQNLYQDDNLTGVAVKDYFIKLIQNLFDSYNIRPDDVNLDMEIQSLNLDVDTVIPIGLIVNELVSNSLKYAFPEKRNGKIKVSLAEINKQLILSVEDNGIGIDAIKQKELGESFGFRLIQVFKDQLKAELVISSDHGTKVEMKINKYSMAKKFAANV